MLVDTGCSGESRGLLHKDMQLRGVLRLMQGSSPENQQLLRTSPLFLELASGQDRAAGQHPWWGQGPGRVCPTAAGHTGTLCARAVCACPGQGQRALKGSTCRGSGPSKGSGRDSLSLNHKRLWSLRRMLNSSTNNQHSLSQPTQTQVKGGGRVIRGISRLVVWETC